MTGCGEPGAPPPAESSYSIEDFASVRKFDAHVHASTVDPAFLEQARADDFELLSLHVDSTDFPPLEMQEEIALTLTAADPTRFHYATTYSVARLDEPTWTDEVQTHLRDAVARGAVAVKIWKNIGMEARYANGDLVAIDDPGLAPVMRFIRDLGVPAVGHQGEPRNCWLPLESMTSAGDRAYYASHPEYHMYLHPEMPAYEDHLQARDQMLARTPGLVFVGAHVASLEWSVDRLGAFFDANPTASADLARLPQVQEQSARNHDAVRHFFLRYQDRLLYGTDLIHAPGDDAREFRAVVHERWVADWRYLATAESQFVPDIGAPVRGLQLPRTVVNKIYWANARRVFGLDSASRAARAGSPSSRAASFGG